MTVMWKLVVMMLQAEDVLKREIGPSNDSDVETSSNDASAACGALPVAGRTERQG